MPNAGAFPSATNVFIPQDISGRLRVGFSRNPNTFGVANYAQYVDVQRRTGFYLQINSQEAARVINTQDFEWPDGQPRPASDTGTESFEFVPFLTRRFTYQFRVGDQAAGSAEWPLIEQHSQIHAAKCMTARTVRMLALAGATAGWAAAADTDNLSVNHHSTATALTYGGTAIGALAGATVGDPRIRKAFGAVQEIINRDTLGVVNSTPAEFFAIMNPNTALVLGGTAEIVDYLRGSPAADAQVRSGFGTGAKYNLPPTFFGFTIAVENTVRTTSRKGVALARTYALADNLIIFATRIGGLDGIYGAPSFSTLTVFYNNGPGGGGEMQVEVERDNWDRLTKGAVTEETAEAITCPASGFLLNIT